MSGIVLPSIILTTDNQLLAEFEIIGLNTGKYTATLTLTRQGGVMSAFTDTVLFQAGKLDSTIATLAPAEDYDGSGGSFGIFGLFSLLGLGFLRRNKTSA